MDRETAAPTERILRAFRSRLRTYLGIVGVTAVIAAGISLLLPVWFKAHSTLLPPDESGGTSFGMLSGMIQSSALSTLGFNTTTTPSDVFAEILKSRRLTEAAVVKFDYARIYKRKGIDRTVKEFQRHLKVDVNPAGVLMVSFEDHEAKRAADVTNFLVTELDRFNVDTYKTRGKRLRMFLEGRLGEVQQQLVAAEQRLMVYEREHRILSSPESDKVSGMSGILVQKFNLETQRAYVSSYSSPNNTELQNIERQLSALNTEIGKLPDVKREGAKLTLDVEVQRKLVVLMTSQYEDARMQETRDTPTVTVLDNASQPEIRDRPRRAVLVAGAVLAALLGCAAWTAVGLSRES